MASSQFLVYVVFILLLVIILWYVEHIRNFWLRLFSDKPKKKTVLVCPKCGSTDWKYPNPLKPSESMINVYQMAHQLSECQDCHYIGIFYSTDESAAKSLLSKRRKAPKKS